MEVTQMYLNWEYKAELSHMSDMIYQNMYKEKKHTNGPMIKAWT